MTHLFKATHAEKCILICQCDHYIDTVFVRKVFGEPYRGVYYKGIKRLKWLLTDYKFETIRHQLDQLFPQFPYGSSRLFIVKARNQKWELTFKSYSVKLALIQLTQYTDDNNKSVVTWNIKTDEISVV